MTPVPLTKVPLGGSWPKLGSLVMVPVEIGRRRFGLPRVNFNSRLDVAVGQGVAGLQDGVSETSCFVDCIFGLFTGPAVY